MTLLEIIGWMGGLGFMLCGFPLTYTVWKTKTTQTLSWAFVSLWGMGEVCTLIYVVLGNYLSGVWQIPLIANYVINFFFLCYIIYAKTKYEQNFKTRKEYQRS